MPTIFRVGRPGPRGRLVEALAKLHGLTVQNFRTAEAASAVLSNADGLCTDAVLLGQDGFGLAVAMAAQGRPALVLVPGTPAFAPGSEVPWTVTRGAWWLAVDDFLESWAPAPLTPLRKMIHGADSAKTVAASFLELGAEQPTALNVLSAWLDPEELLALLESWLQSAKVSATIFSEAVRLARSLGSLGADALEQVATQRQAPDELRAEAWAALAQIRSVRAIKDDPSARVRHLGLSSFLEAAEQRGDPDDLRWIANSEPSLASQALQSLASLESGESLEQQISVGPCPPVQVLWEQGRLGRPLPRVWCQGLNLPRDASYDLQAAFWASQLLAAPDPLAVFHQAPEHRLALLRTALRYPKRLEVVLRFLATDAEPSIRVAALRALALDPARPEVVQLLEAAVLGTDMALASAALPTQAAGAPILYRAVQRASLPQIRARALWWLAELEAPPFVRALERALASPELVVRAMAVRLVVETHAIPVDSVFEAVAATPNETLGAALGAGILAWGPAGWGWWARLAAPPYTARARRWAWERLQALGSPPDGLEEPPRVELRRPAQPSGRWGSKYHPLASDLSLPALGAPISVAEAVTQKDAAAGSLAEAVATLLDRADTKPVEVAKPVASDTTWLPSAPQGEQLVTLARARAALDTALWAGKKGKNRLRVLAESHRVPNEIRVRALRHLARDFDDPDIYELLKRLLAAPHSPLRTAALGCLLVRRELNPDTLIGFILSPGPAAERIRALRHLANHWPRAQIHRFLEQILEGNETLLHIPAAEALFPSLRQLPPSAREEALINLASDHESFLMRVAAVKALGALAEAKGRQALEKYAGRRGDPVLREAAQKALQRQR